MFGKSFISHQVLEIVTVETVFKNFLDNRSTFINVDHGGLEFGLSLPSAESITDILSDEMTKQDLLLLRSDFITMDLSSHMTVVLEEFPSVDFLEGVGKVPA